MASSLPTPQFFNIQLQPGPLGVSVAKAENGWWLVSSKSNASSPLQVDDVIVSLNGVKLVDVEGGVKAIVKLFQAFGAGPRNLVVGRVPTSPSPLAATASVTTAPAAIKKEPARPDCVSSAPIVPAAASSAKPTFKLKTCDTCKVTQWHGIGSASTCGKCRAKTQGNGGGTTTAVQTPALVHNPSQMSLEQRQMAEARAAAGYQLPAGYQQKSMTQAFHSYTSANARQSHAATSTAGQKKKAHAMKPSTKHNAAAAKKQKVAGSRSAKKKPAASSYSTKKSYATTRITTMPAARDNFNHDEHYLKMARDGFPKPGFVSPCKNYYITETKGECYRTIAEKVGMDDWKDLISLSFNLKFYGRITANKTFLDNTIVKLPTEKCSKWKLNKLVDNHVEEVKSMGKCTKCLKFEQAGDTDQMLICDGCDALVHTSCAGLLAVPVGDWLCGGCLEVLSARRKANAEVGVPRDSAGRRSLLSQPPSLPKLNAETLALGESAETQFKKVITARKEAALGRMEENQSVLANATRERIANLTREVQVAYRNSGHGNEVRELMEDLEEANRDEHGRPAMETEDRKQLLLNFAALLCESKKSFETRAQYLSRMECPPVFLGIVKMEDADIRVLNVLKEPTQLVLSIPISHTTDAMESGMEYYLFGTKELFSIDRNDYTPMDFSPTSTRTAQRDLMAMLQRDPRNSTLHLSPAVIPSSVSLRGTSSETLGDVVKCFDLSELVRDCHYPIQNQPKTETPQRLADNGLELRDYQKTSLQWLLDKENNPSGIGSHGELWARKRGVSGGSSVGYYYSPLTGTLTREIFNYEADVEQKDVSKLCGDSYPSAAIIGSEMGLGKTVIALALVVGSPPALKNRILPREHVGVINHPAYSQPPSAHGCTSSARTTSFVSNGTLVIAPMTLCPQWQSEIQRFAPWMRFVTLHNDETETAATIASKDIVVISSYMMSQPPTVAGRPSKAGQILSKLRQIHFHRVFLDESHYNNTGDRVKLSLAQLSATHRYCVTGTPVGHSLADLYGQLRFLRIPQFCRKDFWQQCIDQPYSEHNVYALNVLRSLLSRMVIRHSKEQTVNDGNALVALPPRTVETLILPFASDVEKQVYEYIETRNTNRFMELRSESPATVVGKYIELTGMMYSARLACGHGSLVNLESLHKLNESLERERHRKLGYGAVAKTKEKNKHGSSRADIFREAISKARPSAAGRMREAVLQFQEGEIEMMECPICLEPTGEKNIALTPCAHKFCSECILGCMSSFSSSREPTGVCPECRETVMRSEITFLGDADDAGKSVFRPADDDQKPTAVETSVDINGFHLSTKDTFTAACGAGARRVVYQTLGENERRQQRSYYYSLKADFLGACNIGVNQIGTKVARLLQEITSMIQLDPTAKAVVFSQFLGTLDVCSQEIAARGIGCCRVDGMMKQHHRADAIDSFVTNPTTRVLLLSMRAGAAGLNLMAANHCFIMDVATNTAVEEQAIDRIHRIGQTRPVMVKRLVIKDTIEERILENRRSLAADRPAASTQLDGTTDLIMEDDCEGEQNKSKKKRDRHEDENGMGEKTFQRLRHLEAIFGCSATVKISKA